jgi:Fungal Zn(2)-Cys(6) binuclear cluster domain
MSKGQPLISPSATRRRGPTKRAMASTVIKRSSSSPNVRVMASNDTSSMSMSDKRRNKLGYHRTSVACGQFTASYVLFEHRRERSSGRWLTLNVGHCRRRKIRCLLAPGDPQGRCSNCIRLKKECNFYPVDQQPPPEMRPRSGSKADISSSNDAGTSTSSSPVHHSGGNVVEQIDNYQHLPPHPLQTNQGSQTFNQYSASTLSPPGRSMCHISMAPIHTDNPIAPMSGLSYEFSPSFDPSPSWDTSPFLGHSPQGLAIDRSFPEETVGTFWRPSGSPLPTAYRTPQLPIHASSMSVTPSSQDRRDAVFSQGARDDRSWHPPPAPIRSMSLATPEELPPHYQARYFHQPLTVAGQGPGSSGVAATTLHTHATQGTAAPESHLVTEINARGHRGRTGQPAGLGFPQWGSYPQQFAQMVESGREGLSHDWYTTSPDLAQVQEEDSGPHHFQQPSASAHHSRNPG